MSTILVVEDEPALRDIIVSVLLESGYIVRAASDGYEALRILVERPIDLLITDIVMPGINGFQLARQAKVMRPTLLLMYITGCQFDIAEGLAPSGGRLIRKPIRRHNLLMEVDRQLAGRAGA